MCCARPGLVSAALYYCPRFGEDFTDDGRAAERTVAHRHPALRRELSGWPGRGGSDRRPRPPREGPRLVPTVPARDPVCGMAVEAGTGAGTVIHLGQTIACTV
jgi:hypothetical protein